MFLNQNSRGESFGCVVLVYRDGPLQDDDAMVDRLIDKVNGAACDLRAESKRLRLSVEAWKAG